MRSHCSSYQNVYFDCACASPTFFRRLSKAPNMFRFGSRHGPSTTRTKVGWKVWTDLIKLSKKGINSVGRSAGLLSGRSWVQTPVGPTLMVFRWLRRKSCLCNDICKWLDFLVLSDKDRRSRLTALSLVWFLWDIKEPTPLFEKSRGRRPRWCGQPFLHGLVGLSVRRDLNIEITLWPFLRSRDGYLQIVYKYFCFCLQEHILSTRYRDVSPSAAPFWKLSRSGS